MTSTDTPAPEARTALARALEAHRPPDAAEAADLERAAALLTAPEGARTAWDRATPLHFTASALVVHRASRRVLLRHHERQGTWLHVGGHADPGETDPLGVALREGVEETGLPDLTPWPDASPLHLVIVPVAAAGSEPAHEHVDLRYVLVTEQPEAARAERETAPVRWFSFEDARAATAADNLRETLRRAERLLR